MGGTGEEGAEELPRVGGADWPIGGFCGVEWEGAPVLIVRGAMVFTGEDSREVSENKVLSLTYPSSKSLLLADRFCAREDIRLFKYLAVKIYNMIIIIHLYGRPTSGSNKNQVV